MNRLAVAALFAACVLPVGCREPLPAVHRPAGPPRLLPIADLTDAERRYGHAPTPRADVTYQPDVVMPPGGASAIRAVSGDGLTWTIDPDAEGMDQIQTGKVLLLTSRAAGRVLAVHTATDGLRVVLGPVEVTDVVREGRFSLEQAVDFDQALAVPTPEVFDPRMTVDPLLARFNGDGSHTMVVRPALVNQTTQYRFTLTPLVGARGIGVRITSNAGGMHFMGEAVLYLSAPRLKFDLDISGGKVRTCDVQLTGAAGLLMTFEAGSPSPTTANINERRYVPVDFFIPIGGLGVPFAVNVRQLFELRTAFTSTGTLRARGYYTLSGGLRAGYRDGRFSLGGPTGLSTKESLLRSTDGVAMGVTGLVMTHHAKVIVGIGFAGFATGPYVFLNSSVAVSRGSNIGIVTCREATLAMAMGAGVGYMIPQGVTRGINAILRALNIKEIQDSGGFQTSPMKLVSTTSRTPKLAVCGE